MRHYHLAVLPGDGIGPEVIPESVQTLEALASLHSGFNLSLEYFDWGTERYLREGALMPKDGLAMLERGGFDGILLGPVGDPRVPDHLTLWGLLLPIRQGFDQYVNLRPMRLLPGVQSPLAGKGPAEIDMVCVRENTEGEYSGTGGRIHQGTPDEVAIQSAVFTRKGTERIIRYAFAYARQHGRGRVLSATKSNSLQYSMVFWDEVFKQVGAEYQDIAQEQQLVDSLAARMVAR
ncbi:MAG TPA: isocitrate/isopropylmalate family dehydrogenase, partial [Ktedonobacterales bacterium]